MLRRNLLLITAAIMAFAGHLQAKENVGSSGKVASGLKAMAQNCAAASSQTDLNINNVRTTLLNGGDMWWNLNDARYEIPKIDPPGSAPSVHSIFAGAIWLGGIDQGGQLKIAAQTYRQTGNDFWPGPLDNSASVDATVCGSFDRHWTVLGSDIDDFLSAWAANPGGITQSDVPESIWEWPARGNANAKNANNAPLNTNFAKLAPFWDEDGDGLYNPLNGDYPVINQEANNGVYADQMIFWVYNDRGNVHTETGGQAIGVQINALAFAFSTSDEVNNMTFYRYTVQNKSSNEIGDFYMAQWVDPDLGCFDNDYVGCDTTRELGICYNGTATDPDCGSRGYGDNPPLVGVDYFEGPFADAGNGIDDDDDGIVDEGSDGIDNDGDGLIDGDDIDEPERLGMSNFLFYNNDFSVTGNPETAVHFYNYMSGFWKDNTCFEFGGDGYQEGTFCFPYNFPSPPNDPAGWSECTESNPPADRRFLQASGPFTLTAGSENFITVGVVWVRPTGFACGDFSATIGVASDKAQALFDNDFELVDGPDAPTIKVRELDQALILSLVNEPGSNNEGESYDQIDPVADALAEGDPTITDTTYTFQGYILYQLAEPTVTAEDLDDVSKARIVAQVDIKDDVDKLVNFTFDNTLGADVAELEVDGNNEGIERSFQIKTDLFAEGVNTLVNHKKYYYAAVAYAYNNYKTYDPQNPSAGGQKQPFLQGRRNFKVYSAIPHKVSQNFGGTALNTEYGEGLEVTRLDGQGNGGRVLDLTEESVDEILNSGTGFYGPITYQPLRGPVGVKVYDPLNIQTVDFVMTLIDTTANDSILSPNATWKIEVFDSNGLAIDTIYSERDISKSNEQLLQEYGISVSINQVGLLGREPGFDPCQANDPEFIPANGLIESTIEWEDNEEQWLTGFQDEGTFSSSNWIRCGTYIGPEDDQFEGFYDSYYDECTDIGGVTHTFLYDGNCEFGNVVNGWWAPYSLAANLRNDALIGGVDPILAAPFSYGPAFPWRHHPNFTQAGRFRIPPNNLDELQGVDVVITPDKSKWTRCIVFETGEDENLNVNGAKKGQIRYEPSLDIDGNVVVGDTGRSWFPGYAINVETGERLNMAFGEASWLGNENGRDMTWNPTSNVYSPVPPGSPTPLIGGRHHIYVFKSRYDEGAAYQQTMVDSFNFLENLAPTLVESPLQEIVYDDIMWVGVSTLNPDFELKSWQEGLVPSEAKIRIRVNRPYEHFVADGSNNGLPKYQFSTVGKAPTTQSTEVASDACDEIRAVPNPYYAYSAYETSQLDNRVKITNLPNSCKITIYTLDGVLIRQFERAVGDNTSQGVATDAGTNLDNTIEWDLKNNKNIPIASGVYLIHIEADGVCEKTIKWFGTLRPIDLDTF